MGILEGIVGALIGFIASLCLIRFNYKDLYAKTVTLSRRESNNLLRDSLTTVISCCKIYNLHLQVNKNIKCDKNYQRPCCLDTIEKMYKSIFICKMMMSIHGGYGNDYHKEMEEALINIENSIRDRIQIKEKNIKEIENYGRFILDYEWKRIKKEAKGEYNEYL